MNKNKNKAEQTVDWLAERTIISNIAAFAVLISPFLGASAWFAQMKGPDKALEGAEAGIFIGVLFIAIAIGWSLNDPEFYTLGKPREIVRATRGAANDIKQYYTDNQTQITRLQQKTTNLNKEDINNLHKKNNKLQEGLTETMKQLEKLPRSRGPTKFRIRRYPFLDRRRKARNLNKKVHTLLQKEGIQPAESE
ncbi:hypothetical protein FHX37_4233 [Haloactinospora alba]|uniref:Uncharacterized protein n=1 Tax=Haloactinospora alba TaxID=405555 RepID=A0A543N6Q5_9ACTN|nr:hypothetical protein [Haloactinospora alba]TQN27512.1 hypothetical protein FHX37_4233 [Haloactinospora alba]